MVVGPGEVLPVDGLVDAGPAVLDESVLTGEPELQWSVRSGSRCAAAR